MALLSEYGFNEGSGSTANDTSGNARHIAVNSARWTASGHTAGGVVGPSTAVDVACGPTGTGQALTLMFWAKANDTNGATMVEVMRGSDRINVWTFRDLVGAGLNGGDYASFDVGTADTWHHLAVVITTTGSLTFYVDGVSRGSGNPGPNWTASRVWVGQNEVGGDTLSPGTIDDLRFFDTALTSGGVTTWMNTPVAAGGEPPEEHSGGSSTGVAITTAGAGSTSRAGSSTTGAAVTTTGTGLARRAGAAATPTSVTAAGAGTKHATGSGTPTLTTVTAGTGQKRAVGGSVATVGLTSTGAGTVVTAGSGGSSTNLDVASTGLGAKVAAGGSVAYVGTTATGSGQAVEPGTGGTVTGVTVTTAAAGAKRAQGGSVATLAAATAGAGTKHGRPSVMGLSSASVVLVSSAADGYNPDAQRDITLTLPSPQGHPLRLASPRTLASIGSPSGHPATITSPRSTP